MAIHYSGPVSKTPGRVACDAASDRAVSAAWQGTDCDRCKTSLVGLTVERTALDMPERFIIATVELYRVGVAWSDDENVEPDWLPLNDLDAHDIDANAPMWRVVL